MNSHLKSISVFIGLVLLQALVLNQVNLNGLVNPYVFPLFIILLPYDTKPIAILLLAFFIGLIVDLFNGTIGMHAFACTFMAYLRPFFLSNFESKADKFLFPSLNNNGFVWMFSYVTFMISVHHLVYFFIEAGTFYGIFHSLTLFLLSTLCSVFIIFLLLYVFKPAKK